MKKIYMFPAIIEELYDGDTLYVDIDLGFDTWLKHKAVRIDKINTPEIKTRNKLEKEAGLRVAEYVEQLMPVGTEIMLISNDIENLTEKVEEGKFGRIIGDIVFGDDVELADLLLEKNFAVPFDARTSRDPFTEEFLINIINSEEIL